MKYNIPILLFVLFCFYNTDAQSLFIAKNENIISQNQIVALVDSIEITAEEFFYNYEFGPAFPKRQKNSKEIHLNFMINEKLLALEGYETGMLNKDDIKNIYSDINSDLATEELFRDEILSQVVVNDKEINVVVNNKNNELEIRWLYSYDEKIIKKYEKLLMDDTKFDSLFNSQINDTVFYDQRQMKISMYNLNKKNPILANLIDTMRVGNISSPIQTPEGWYIVRFDNRIVNVITTESERNKLSKEAHDAVTKHKMDSLSDSYVNNVLFQNKPTIKRDAFNILRSYIGKYSLTSEQYEEWALDQKLETALSNLGISKNDNYPGIILVESLNKNFILDEFLYWYKNRQLYIKFDKNDLPSYSKSLENLIWIMLRDKLLTQIAKNKNYFEDDWVLQQSKWWKDKIVYAAIRKEYANSLTINNNEIKSADNDKSKIEKMSSELSKKILHKVLELKKKHKIKINNDVLDKINVSSEEDRKAIDFYSIKKGGLIPRPAYPTIDPDWANWL